MNEKRHPLRVSLFEKFALVIVAVGIIPIVLLTTVFQNRLLDKYRQSLEKTYAEGLNYAAYSISARLNSYNSLSKFCYYYSYASEGDFSYDFDNYDNLRKILTGEAFPNDPDPAGRTQREMARFLSYLLKTNSNIEAVHFLYRDAAGAKTLYHAGNYKNRFFDDDAFQAALSLGSLDTASKKMLLFPTHSFNYVGFNSTHTSQVFTVGRNYFNLTGPVGFESYVGTLLIDLRADELSEPFRQLDLSEEDCAYAADAAGICYFSTDPSLVGRDLRQAEGEYRQARKGEVLLSSPVEGYDLTVWCRLSGVPMAQQIQSIQRILYLFAGLSLLTLLAGSVFFSKRLTNPLRRIMGEMAQVETGQFKRQIPVTSNDELGELTARFNQMTTELDNYTNQVYVAKIQQTEAELNALKSQIYPHFLYNTLEIIRMTAVSHSDEMVARMVEALSDQIRYLIGTVSDLVPLQSEVEILQKYIFLINCRFDNKVEFQFSCDDMHSVMIPKLILQPLVENAFVHGIKPMEGRGRIQLQERRSGGNLILSVLDNGVGMNEAALHGIEALLASDKPGRKNEYRWESIGLKNVHDRLRYLYGPQYGIRLFSTPGMGTVIQVTVPGNLKRDQEGTDTECSK